MEVPTLPEGNRASIKKYQCCGCLKGMSPELDADGNSCFKVAEIGQGCGAHIAGTMMSWVGKLFLGMPKGFNRLGRGSVNMGPPKDMPLSIFKSFNDFIKQYDKGYDMFNVPVWKHKTAEGHILVRGMQPRRGDIFLHVFLEDCLDKVNCFEISNEIMEQMD